MENLLPITFCFFCNATVLAVNGVSFLASYSEDLKNLTASVSSLTTVLAVILGGWWTYRNFGLFREAQPKIQFTVDLLFIQKHQNRWIVEVLAVLENKGGVRHQIKDFTFTLRYAFPGDNVGPQVHNGLRFPLYLHRHESQESWLASDWNFTFIEPGVSTRYSCGASIPEEATVVLVHGKFRYEQIDEIHTADRLVAVPTVGAATK